MEGVVLILADMVATTGARSIEAATPFAAPPGGSARSTLAAKPPHAARVMRIRASNEPIRAARVRDSALSDTLTLDSDTFKSATDVHLAEDIGSVVSSWHVRKVVESTGETLLPADAQVGAVAATARGCSTGAATTSATTAG